VCSSDLCSFWSTGRYLSEWWKQLFGESEGKNNQALWLSSVKYSTDLHSLGQFIQDGQRVAFETVVKVDNPPHDVIIPQLDGEDDGVGYLTGKSLAEINQAAFEATVAAHHDGAYGGVPVVVLNIPEISVYHIGSYLYFMLMSCAVSAYILAPDGNPFDQPGVEFYKNNMFKLLGKK
jgi:glucose-6-phosphate isomerase